MTIESKIEEIRAAVRGKEMTAEMSGFLYRQHCYYLIAIAGHPLYKTRLAAEQMVNRLIVEQRYSACKSVFEKIQFPYAIIKGAVLSKQIYGSPFLRMSCDMDFLVSKKNVDELKQILLSCGFILGRITNKGVEPFNRREVVFQNTVTHQTAPFVKTIDSNVCQSVVVDINHSIMWGESTNKIDTDFVLSHLEEDALCKTSFKKLDREIEFISLCLHHYKDMNSLYLLVQGKFGLNLFCDIYFYLLNASPDVLKLTNFCKDLHIGKYVYVCLHHTYSIFNDDIVLKYLNALEKQADQSLLNTFGLRQDEIKEWDMNLFERIFANDLGKRVYSHLSRAEKEKLMVNQYYM